MSDLIKQFLEVLISQFGRDAVEQGLRGTQTFVPDRNYVLNEIVESLGRWYRRTTPAEERLPDDLKKDISLRMSKYQDGACLAHYIAQKYLGSEYQPARYFVTDNWDQIVKGVVKIL